MSLKIFISLVLVIGTVMHLTEGYSVLGGRNQFEENNSKYQRNRPIFVFCDELGNHLNCMLQCKSMGHSSGHCASDFLCNCL